MNEVFIEGARYFNNRDFFECHDVWEELWFDSTGPERLFLQGMIQIAVGYYHASNDNYKGARSLFEKALPKLISSPPSMLGLKIVDYMPVFESHHLEFSECLNDSKRKFDINSTPELTLLL